MVYGIQSKHNASPRWGRRVKAAGDVSRAVVFLKEGKSVV
jgi:hypothetical protein